MHRTQNFGKRKLGGANSNPSEYFASPKNQRVRPCRDIVYTEDRVAVRKLYFAVSAADVSSIQITHIPSILHNFKNFRAPD